MRVLCEMTTDGGGWTVFRRRLNGAVAFYRDWGNYKNGFGNLSNEFWLGNDNLHRLTVADDVMVRIDLEDFDGTSHTLNILLLRWQMRVINTGFRLDDITARLVVI